MLIFHVLVSLAGILLGALAVYGMVGGHLGKRTNAWFLYTTIATSVSGFLLPADRFLPSHAIGIMSLIALTFSCAALWRYGLQGGWLKTYTISAVIALYLNVFVLVVQIYRHVPFANQLAPTQTEPAFQVTQLVVLVAFLGLGVLAVKGVRKWSGWRLNAATV